ncbi:MAG: hypothetical protein ACT4QG_15710 [Sporichthyaceae bacterium]
MTASALGTRFGACMLLFGCLPALSQATAGATPTRWTGFDEDPFSISVSAASASGSATWSRGSSPRDVRGVVTGRMSGSGCAKMEVAWLNSGSTAISNETGKVCAGSGFAYSFVSPALECVRVTLAVGRASSSKVLCAGGT